MTDVGWVSTIQEGAAKPEAPGAPAMRFKSIEGLRFWMAWWVLVGHACNLAGISKLAPGYMSPLFNAAIAVNVFIIVSGFVVTHLLINNPEPYGRYIGRRAFRLWPAYLLGLALILFVPQAFRFAFVELPYGVFRDYDAARLAAVEPQLTTHILLHLSMLHGMVPHELLAFADSSILSPAWSISLEWQFYLVAPFCVAILRRSTLSAVLFSLFVILLVIGFRTQDVWHWRFPAFLPLSAHFFLVGILSRLLLDRPFVVARPMLYLGLAAIGSVVTVVLADGLLGFHLGREFAIWSVFYLFVLYENGRVRGGGTEFVGALMRAIGSNWLVCRMGAISYSTYILHIPVFALVLFGAAFLMPIESRSTVVALLGLAVLLMVPLSFLSYNLVETPLNQWARRRLAVPRSRDAQMLQARASNS